MFNDPFLSTNIIISKTDQILDVIYSIPQIGPLFYGTGMSSADTKTPLIVREILQNTLEEYASKLHNRQLFLRKIWVNINPPGAYQPRHSHSEFPVAGTYYLKVPDNSGNIVFYHPSPHVEALQRLKPYYSFTHTHVPIDNDLLIWPGYLEHEVSYNYSNDNRITVSFCLDL